MNPAGSVWHGLVGNGPWRHGHAFGVLDVGRSKLCCYIARPRPGRGVQLLGRGYQLAEGLKAGEIVDAEAAESSMLATLHEAEQQAGETLREIVLAVSGGRPQSTFVRVACQLHGRAVTEADLQLLLDRARRSASTPEREVLHAVPIEVTVDGGRPLKDLVASPASGSRSWPISLPLPARRCATFWPASSAAMSRSRASSAPSYAGGLACLAQDELERGCLVLDMGGGTTGLTISPPGGYLGRSGGLWRRPYHGRSRLRPVDQPFPCRAGQESVRRHPVPQLRRRTRIELPVLGDHADMPTGEVPRTRITEIVRARAEEILTLVRRRLDEHRELLAARPARSIVLTGGGSQLEGLEELVQEVFALPTRCGRPGALQTARVSRISHAAPRRPARSGWCWAMTAGWAGAIRSKSRCYRMALPDLANGLERTSDRF